MAHLEFTEFPRKSISVRAACRRRGMRACCRYAKTKPLLEISDLNLDKAGVPVQFVQSLHNAELINLMFDF